jgi:hypothetical protein
VIPWIPACAGMTIFCPVGSCSPMVGVTRQKLYTPGHIPDKVGNKTCRNINDLTLWAADVHICPDERVFGTTGIPTYEVMVRLRSP